MPGGAAAILSYGRFNRRRRRLIVVTALLTVLACPLFYRRHELSQWAQLRYHRLALHRAQRRAVTLHVDPGLLAVDEPTNASPVDRTWALAWQRMTSEFEDVVGLSGLPSASNPAIVLGYSDAGYTPLLIAPMTATSGVRCDVVVLAKGGSIVTELWTPNAAGVISDRKTWWSRTTSSLNITDLADRRRYFTGAFNPSAPSQFRITCEFDGVSHEIVGQLLGSGTVSFSGNHGWWDSHGSQSVAFRGERATTELHEYTGSAPMRFAMPDELSTGIILDDGRLILAGIEQWHVYSSLGSKTFDTLTPQRPTQTWRKPVCFSPSGKFFLAGSELDGWHVIRTFTQSIVCEAAPRAVPTRAVLTDQQLVLVDPHGGSTRIDLQSNQLTTDESPPHGVLLSQVNDRAAFAAPALDQSPSGTRVFVKIVDLGADKVMTEFDVRGDADIPSLTLSPDGKFASFLCGRLPMGKAMSIRSTANGAEVFNAGSLPLKMCVGPVIWSPDGRRAAFHDMKYVYLVSAPNFDHCWRIPVPSSLARPIRFSTNGRWLIATTSADASAHVWDLEEIMD